MDIQSVYENMLQGLPLAERSLAKGIVESTFFKESTRTRGNPNQADLPGHDRQGWRRKPFLRLPDAVDEIVSLAESKKTIPRRINLFCDTLFIPSGTNLTLQHDSGLRLSIWARKVVQENTANTPAFSMPFTDGAALIIYATEFPSGFSVDFGLPGAQRVKTVPFNSETKLGKVAEYRNGTLDLTDRDPPDEDMQNISYMHRINEDGTVDEDPFWHDDLPRLVQFQFLVATTQIFRDPSLALSLLNFVCSATDVPSSRDYNFQATTLRSSIVARLENNVSYIPSVNIFASKEVLQARLLAAQRFEDDFHVFIGKSRDNEYLNLAAANMVYASNDAMSEYNFLEGLARKHYTENADALEKAQKSFSARQDELKKAGEKFQQGIQKLKKDQEMEAVKEGIFAAIEVIGAIALTVATAGAAAPAVVAAGVHAVSKVSTVSKIIQKIKEIVGKLKKIYEKFKPMIKKLAALVEAVKKIVAILNQAKSIAEKPNQLEPASTDMDEINGMRVWDDFVIDVTSMFDEIQGYEIEDKAPYKVALLKLSVSGKAVLATQTAVITSGEALTTILLKEKLQNDQTGRLEKALSVIGKNSRVVSVLERAMFDRVIAIRGLAFLDFWNYSLAYQYHTLSQDTPIGLSALKPIKDYGNDAARLQAAIASFGSTLIVQQKNFVVDMALSDEVIQTLRSTGQATTPLALDAPAFQSFCRIRLKRARCFLKGLKTTTPSNDTTTVRAFLTTDARFYDRDLPTSYKAAGRVTAVSEINDTAITLARAFVGNRRTVLFEYAPSNGSVLCDGEFGQRDDYTKLTPFTDWHVDISNENGTVPQGLDWTGFE
ncbi:MAG: hypothetical protein M4579_006787, partial [Chaenotheca gracillima]